MAAYSQRLEPPGKSGRFKAAWLTLHIIKASASAPFTAEVLAFEPAFNPQYSSLFSIAGSFSTAEAAFEAAFKWVVQFCQARQHSVTHINNPCNCEFLSAQSQQQVVQKQGVNVTVTVNASSRHICLRFAAANLRLKHGVVRTLRAGPYPQV